MTDFELFCEFMGYRRQAIGEYGKVSYWKRHVIDGRKRGSFVGYRNIYSTRHYSTRLRHRN